MAHPNDLARPTPTTAPVEACGCQEDHRSAKRHRRIRTALTAACVAITTTIRIITEGFLSG
ncbi:hypothetical protein [Actinomadura kijaniata]|uniref:hypothetical protein n=1 Tax=Actinomadura kijaniata TaxID=46161 RepID=UPI0008375FCC|nr:hypothetical protein [Actinomadura kijaniata]